MSHAIWLTEGLSCQCGLLRNIRLFAQTLQVDLTVFASHRQPRYEILSEADFSLTEPADDNDRLMFILSVTEKYGIQTDHAGRNTPWFETHRNTITVSGTRLTTGVVSLSDYAVADDKVRFAAAMESHGLPVVPSVHITSAAQLRDTPAHSPVAMFRNPERRISTPQQYLSAYESTGKCTPQVLMPYLPGLFALRSPGPRSADEVREYDRSAFRPVVVRPLTSTVSNPFSLNNAIH
ncbi:hypothetical protein ACISK3_12140 [Morganella morganii]|nr:hypothetical protein [Morganella morganii]